MVWCATGAEYIVVSGVLWVASAMGRRRHYRSVDRFDHHDCTDIPSCCTGDTLDVLAIFGVGLLCHLPEPWRGDP